MREKKNYVGKPIRKLAISSYPKKQKLQRLEKKRIDDLVKEELGVYQRFLLYLYKENK